MATTPDNHFVFASSAGTQQVLAFSVGDGGRLTSLPSLVLTGGGDPDPSVIAIAPDGDHAYVADPGPEAIRVLSVGADGTLAQQDIDPISGVTNTYGVAITPDGEYLYATAIDGVQSRIYGFSIAADGALTQLPGPGLPISAGLSTISVTPDGFHLYTASDGGSVNGFNIGAGGSLSATLGSPYGSGFSGALAASPSRARLYATRSDTPGPSGVAVFTFATDGALTPVAGSPFASSRPTDTIAVPPDDRFVYAAGGPAMTLTTGYEVGVGGALSIVPGASISAGPYYARPGSSVVSPNQPPVAAVSIGRGTGAGVVEFDGSGSTDFDGELATYSWAFGDGKSATGATVTHTYAIGQDYDATLTTTDDEGCSTVVVFTGQTASCNGGDIARDRVELDLIPPSLTVSAERKQRVRKAVSATVSCNDECDVVASGRVSAKPRRLLKRGLELQPVDVSVSTATVPIRLQLSRGARKSAKRALRRGAKLKATVNFAPAEALVDGEAVTRTVKIRP